jgi:hypothetical protein
MPQLLTSWSLYRIEGVMMPAAGIDSKSLTNAWRKTNEQELFNQLKTDYGFSQALSKSQVQLMHPGPSHEKASQVVWLASSSEILPLRLVPAPCMS